MKQPPGFTNRSFSYHVCLLHRSIYGLCQVPCTWFDGFSNALFEIGFIRSLTDTSMFIHYAPYGLTILLLYVDDIIITGASSTFIYFIIARLHYRFEVKDLGPLQYFLGIKVHRDASRIHLSQTKDALELLKRANFLLAKPCYSLVTMSTKLTKDDNTPQLVDATSYRSIVGALQHLTMT